MYGYVMAKGVKFFQFSGIKRSHRLHLEAHISALGAKFDDSGKV